MNREFLGVALALLASLSFESAYLLMAQQSRLVRRSGRPGARFLFSLLHRPRWLLAVALNGAGIMLELFALRKASLIVVQPLMSVGLIGLVLAAGVFLGERIDRWTVLAAGAVASGVAFVIVAAPSEAAAVRLAHPVAAIVVLGVLALVLVSAYVGRGKGGWVALGARGGGGRHARRHLRQRDRPIVGGASAAGDRLDRGGRGERDRLADRRVRGAAAASGVPGRADRLLDGAVLPVVLIALLSPQRLSLSPGAATLLALGLVLTGGGAYRLGATARGGPLAAD